MVPMKYGCRFEIVVLFNAILFVVAPSEAPGSPDLSTQTSQRYIIVVLRLFDMITICWTMCCCAWTWILFFGTLDLNTLM